MIKTVVELDLAGYSDIARELEENLSAEVVAHFNEQIQSFVDAGLSAAGVPREQTVMATTGDGAILLFDEAAQAHHFAQAVHETTQNYNATKNVASAKRWFRIGAATGDIAVDAENKKMAGITIANAVRLEAKGNIGSFLIDLATYNALPSELQRLYNDEEQVPGKREEKFSARRYVVFPELPETKPKTNNSAVALWREKLQYLQEQEAITADPNLKFALRHQIAEAKRKIEEAGG